MTWLLFAYSAVGYYYFRMMLDNITTRDSIGTILLNAMLVLTVGPMLLIPATLFGWATRG